MHLLPLSSIASRRRLARLGWLLVCGAFPVSAGSLEEWVGGGSGQDILFSLTVGADDGMLLGGYSDSAPGIAKTSAHYGGYDFWLVRRGADGGAIWESSFGGTADDWLASARVLSDGDVLAGGTSLSSSNGNRSALGFGLRDFWVVRADPQGAAIWDRAYGGSSSDYLEDMLVLGADGGALLAGYSFSQSGVGKTSPAYGLFDYWVVRIDAQGGVLWDRSFGGAGHDYLHTAAVHSDGGFLLAGYSYSNPGGTKTAPARGGADVWLVSTDSTGVKQWERAYGGSGDDVLRAVCPAPGGGFLLAGQSSSPAGGEKTSPAYGGSDYWVVLIDPLGNPVWDRSFGGAGEDQLWCAHPKSDGGYLLGGWSDSQPGASKSGVHFGLADFWIVAIDAAGDRVWDATFGGTGDDVALALGIRGNGDLVAAGYSLSGVSGNKTASNLGQSDYWTLEMPVAGPSLETGPFYVRPLSGAAAGIGSGFRFLLAGPTDREYVLQFSTDLRTWTAFQTNRLTQPEMEILDTEADPAIPRFYRALVVP